MTIEAMTGSRAWMLAGWTMIHFLWVGGAIGTLAAAARLAMRRASPEIRHGAALLSLGLMAVSPAAIAWRIAATDRDRPIAVSEDVTPLPRVSILAESEPNSMIVTPVIPATVSIEDRPRGGSWLELAASALPWFWLAGTPATLAFLALGFAGADRLRRRSRPMADGPTTEMARRLAEAIGIARPVAVGVCDRLATPLLIGVVRPMILLPAASLSGWDAGQIEMVLWHELAHVRRFDNAVNLVQRLVESLLFFHPAVWWASGWIRWEREHCCDRLVVAKTGQARPYAELLASLAMAGGRHDAVALAMAESPIVSRIRSILNPEDYVMPLSRTMIALAVALLITPAALIAAAQVVGPAKPAGAPRTPDANRIEELIRRTRHGAEMFMDVQERIYTMIQLASIRARAGDREAARGMFQEAERLAETVSFDDATYYPHILIWIVQAEQRMGFRDEAIAASRKLLRLAEAPARKENTKQGIYSELIKIFLDLGDRDGVQETLRAGIAHYSTKAEPGFEAFTPGAIVGLRAASGDLVGALRMVEAPGFIKNDSPENVRNLTHKALFGVVGAIGEKNREGADEVLAAAMRDVDRRKEDRTWIEMMTRNQHLHAIAQAESRIGRFTEAVKTARMIETETVPEHMVKARIAEFMDEQRFKKTQAMAEIAQVQAKAGDRAGARRTAEEAATIGRTIQRDNMKYPIEQTAEALAMADDLDGALRLAGSLEPGMRFWTIESIAGIRREAGDVAGARKAAEMGRDLVRKELAGLDTGKLDPDTPSGKQGYHLLETLGRFEALLGDHKTAIVTIRKINDVGAQEKAMQRIATNLASAGDLDGAIEAVDAIGSPKSRAKALQSVAGAYSRSRPTR